MSRPFAWRECDCTTAVAEVYRRLHGVDLIAPWRAEHTGKRGALSIVREAGGPLLLAESMALHCGLSPGEAVGGVGLRFCAGPVGASLAICVEPGCWAGKSLDGYALFSNVDACWHA